VRTSVCTCGVYICARVFVCGWIEVRESGGEGGEDRGGDAGRVGEREGRWEKVRWEGRGSKREFIYYPTTLTISLSRALSLSLPVADTYSQLNTRGRGLSFRTRARWQVDGQQVCICCRIAVSALRYVGW
jgi:hypothetical protein